jgi:hypothetical protein
MEDILKGNRKERSGWKKRHGIVPSAGLSKPGG